MENSTPSNSLTLEEMNQMQSIINEAFFQQSVATLNARLLQAKSDAKAYNEAIRIALKAGEEETSPYINVLINKLAVAMRKEDELTALTGAERKVA